MGTGAVPSFTINFTAVGGQASDGIDGKKLWVEVVALAQVVTVDPVVKCELLEHDRGLVAVRRRHGMQINHAAMMQEGYR